MAQTAVTPIFLAAMLGVSLRSVERMIEKHELPHPTQYYPREWTGLQLTELTERLAKLPDPAARAASAILERLAPAVLRQA